MGDDKTYLYGKAVMGKGVIVRLGIVALEEGVGKIAGKKMPGQILSNSRKVNC